MPKTFFDFSYDEDNIRCHAIINLEALVAINTYPFMENKLCLKLIFDSKTKHHSTAHYMDTERGEAVFNQILAAWDRVEGWRGFADRVFVSPVRDTGERVAVGVHHIRHVFFKEEPNASPGRLYIDIGHDMPLSLLVLVQTHQALLDRIEMWHTAHGNYI